MCIRDSRRTPSRAAIANHPDFSPAIAWFGSLGRSFGLHQLLCTRSGQMVIGRVSPRRCCPAALFQIIASFPAGRDLLQGCQVCFCVAVLQEFLHADRRERGQDGGVGPLGRKFVGGAVGHPATPRKPNDHRRNRADRYSLEEASPRLARRTDGTCMAFSPSMRGTYAARGARQHPRDADGTRAEAVQFAGYWAYRRHRCCPKGRTKTSVRSRFNGSSRASHRSPVSVYMWCLDGTHNSARGIKFAFEVRGRMNRRRR